MAISPITQQGSSFLRSDVQTEQDCAWRVTGTVPQSPPTAPLTPAMPNPDSPAHQLDMLRVKQEVVSSSRLTQSRVTPELEQVIAWEITGKEDFNDLVTQIHEIKEALRIHIFYDHLITPDTMAEYQKLVYQLAREKGRFDFENFAQCKQGQEASKILQTKLCTLSKKFNALQHNQMILFEMSKLEKEISQALVDKKSINIDQLSEKVGQFSWNARFNNTNTKLQKKEQLESRLLQMQEDVSKIREQNLRLRPVTIHSGRSQPIPLDVEEDEILKISRLKGEIEIDLAADEFTPAANIRDYATRLLSLTGNFSECNYSLLGGKILKTRLEQMDQDLTRLMIKASKFENRTVNPTESTERPDPANKILVVTDSDRLKWVNTPSLNLCIPFLPTFLLSHMMQHRTSQLNELSESLEKINIPKPLSSDQETQLLVDIFFDKFLVLEQLIDSDTVHINGMGQQGSKIGSEISIDLYIDKSVLVKYQETLDKLGLIVQNLREVAKPREILRVLNGRLNTLNMAFEALRQQLA